MTEKIKLAENDRSRWLQILTRKRTIPKKVRYTLYGITAFVVMIWYLFAAQLILLITRHFLLDARMVSAMSVTPTALTDNSQSEIGLSYTRYGISFNLPCDSLSREVDSQGVTVFNCKSGLTVVFEDPSTQPSLRDMLLSKSDSKSRRLNATIGYEALSSNYALMKATLNADPNYVSFRMGRYRAGQLLELSLLKMVEVPYETSHIYSVSNASVNGFEFLKEDKIVELDLFDAQDRKIMFSVSQHNALVSQSDINELLQSIHASDN